MSDPPDSVVIRYLETNGPSTGAEIPISGDSPSVSPGVREYVSRFNPNIANASGGSVSRVGRTWTIFYLLDGHDPETVIREWVSANPNAIENSTPRAFLSAVNNYGSEFSDVSTEVGRDVYGEERWSDAFGGSSGGGSENPGPGGTLADRLEELSPDEVFGNDE